jgi:cell wall-associated NlpC family hydrolase
VRSVRRQAQRAATVVVLLIATLVAGTGVAFAAPPAPPPTPAPPPNPSDQQLDQSKKQVSGAAAEVGRLSGELTEVQAKADQLGMKLEDSQQGAAEALDAQQQAETDAQIAARRVQTTQAETRAASAAIEEAHQKLDEFITAAYLQGVDAGSLGLMIEASGPDDLVRRAELTEALATDQLAALDTLQRARVAKANADSLARAAQEEARRAELAAQAAKRAADSAVDSAEQAVAAGQAALDQVEAQRADIEKQLDELTAKDAGLHAQRQRYLDFQAELAAQAAAAQRGAAGRLRGKATGNISQVIDRALSQIGTTYAWGGGTGSGPSRGIRDGGVADRYRDYHKTGFDCSGLMLYAFGGVGLGLPRYSGNQYNAGKKVPISQMQPGDMLFWSNGSRIHHVALFIGDGKMVEAPYSGGKVKISPVRFGDGLMPYATRML